ncbi:PAS domain S-box protein [bacterium]|nr:PAS domain S-box protein [bacterium]
MSALDENGQRVGTARVGNANGVLTHTAKAPDPTAQSDAQPVAMYIFDLTEQKNLYVNRDIADMLGYTPQDIQALGSDMLGRLLHPDDLQRYDEHHSQLMLASDHDMLNIEYRAKDKEGRYRIMRSRESVFARDENGRPTQKIGMVTDITEQLDAREEAERRRMMSSAITELLHETIFCETETEVAEKCLEIALRLTHSAFGFIGEVNSDGRLDTIAISDTGWNACRIPESNALMEIRNMEVRGIWGTAIQSEQSLLLNDPASHPSSVGTPEGHPKLTSYLGVPLKRRGKTTGVISLANGKHGFTLRDQEMIEHLSDFFTDALGKKRTETELARHQQHLEDLVEEHTAELKERVKELACLHTIAQLINDPDNSLEEILQGIVDIIPPSWKYPSVTTARLMLDHETFTSKAFQEGNWCQSREIFHDDKPVGLLEVFYTDEKPEEDEGPFLEEERALLNTIAIRVQTLLEKRRMEQERDEQLKRLLTIFDSFPEIIYVCDPETYEVLFVNDVFRSKLPEDPVGKTCYEAFQGFNEPCEFCTNDKIQNGIAYTWEHRNEILQKDFRITDQMIDWPDGRRVRFELAVDITEMKKLEAARISSESRFRTLFEHSPVGIAMVDEEGRPARSNQALCNLLGYTPDELAELPFPRFTHPEDADRDLQLYTELYEGKRDAYNVEKRYIRKDGEMVWADLTVSIVRDQDNQPQFAVGMVVDITEKQAAREELNRLMKQIEDKNKELEQIVYVTSHDLRSPLVNVQGFSSELQYSLEDLANKLRDLEIPDDVHRELMTLVREDIPESLRFILSSTSKMDILLKGLLRLSRMGRAALEIETIEMNKLVGRIREDVKFAAEAGNCAVEIGDLPECVGDATQLNQVFTNLIENAMKYRHPERACRVVITGSQEKDRAVYCVEDNGIGIQKEHQDNIFEIFHRLNPGDVPGEGLGLTITRRVLDRLDGSIYVESEPGEGSRFVVSLPPA